MRSDRIIEAIEDDNTLCIFLTSACYDVQVVLGLPLPDILAIGR